MTNKSQIKIIGLIAGAGALPEALARSCTAQGIEVFVIGIEGYADPDFLKDFDHVVLRLGLAGKMIENLKKRNIQDIVLIGSVKRPSLSALRPDIKTAGFFARLGLRGIGDDGMLGAARRELEKEGFRIHAIQDFMDDLLLQAGPVGAIRPGKNDLEDLRYGFHISQEIGRLDIGQSVIVNEGRILGVEAAEGTDALIRRCGAGGILVKSCKPQQDKALDLPTLGADTARVAVEAGLRGIAGQAGKTILVNRDAVRRIADEAGIFVTGIEEA